MKDSHINLCQCPECKKNQYNQMEYIVKKEDFKILDNQRPLGISGHLRVKDEAMSIGQCIDSCIDALDELIITYNKSTDGTEEILMKYAKKYPKKIRLYFYPFDIVLLKDKNKYGYVHSLSNYYNFGYIKIKYQYYIKIDADQIYFIDKLLEIRKILLYYNDSKKNIYTALILDKISFYIPIKKIRNYFRTIFIKKLFNKDKEYKYNGLEECLNFKDFILFSKIRDKKDMTLILGGFDLILKNNNLYINSNFPCNGCVGDHFIINPSSKYKYELQNNGIEVLKIKRRSIIGFAWVHLGSIKRKVNISDDNIIKFNDIQYMSSKEFLNIINKLENNFTKYSMEQFTIKYFDKDKNYLSEDFYNKYMKDILEYAINHQNIHIKRIY